MNDETQSQRVQPDIKDVLGLGKSQTSTLYRRWRLQIIVASVIAAVLGLILIWGAGSSKNAPQYVTESAARQNLTVIVTATGTVQPTNEVDVSSELSGIIRKVLVDYNAKVKVGQVLAELDTDKLKASVDSSRAKVAAAKARVKDAQATVVEKRLDFGRKQALYAKRVSSAHDLEVARAAHQRAIASVESAKADVVAAAADLNLSETNLAKTCICSPINGVVLKRNVEPGQTVATSLQAPVLFSIAEDLSQMEVQVDVDEADVGEVKEGQTAIFSVDAHPDRKFTAKIRELRFGSEVVQGVVTYKAVLTTTNPDLLLRPGMTATAEITVQRVSDALTVPNAALRFSPSISDASADNRGFLQKLISFRPALRPPSAQTDAGPDRKIWILVDGKAKEVAVTIGATDGKNTQIVNGDLKPGQAVILDTVTAKK